MINMMRGMTAMLVLAACAPAAGQTTPKSAPKSAAPTAQRKFDWQFGRATGDTVHFRLGNGGPDRVCLLWCHFAHFGVGEHVFQPRKFRAKPLQLPCRCCHRLHFGIFLGQRNEPVGRQVARGQLRRQLLPLRQ